MEFLVPGTFNDYKKCMIEAAMTKIGQKLQKALPRFTLGFLNGIPFVVGGFLG